jgi:argininosuccinate lyase
VLHLKSKLSSGYHRDFQLLKEPLFRGIDRTAEMLDMMTHAIPLLQVDRARAKAAMSGGTLATDEVMRRVERGQPFRLAYQAVAVEVANGAGLPQPSMASVVSRRSSTGSLGNLGLPAVRSRLRRARRWGTRERMRFSAAMARLAGRKVSLE